MGIVSHDPLNLLTAMVGISSLIEKENHGRRVVTFLDVRTPIMARNRAPGGRLRSGGVVCPQRRTGGGSLRAIVENDGTATVVLHANGGQGGRYSDAYRVSAGSAGHGRDQFGVTGTR